VLSAERWMKVKMKKNGNMAKMNKYIEEEIKDQ